MSEANRASVLSVVWQARRVWLLQLAGNALLFAALFGWLSLPDARWWHLALTAVGGVGIVATTLWLHGGTLAHFQSAHRGEAQAWPPCAAVCRKLPALAAWLGLVLAAGWGVDWVEGQTGDWSVWWASWLTLKLQKPVLLPDVQQAFAQLVFLLRWFVLPLVLLPVAAQAVSRGFAGLVDARRLWRVLRQWRWWLGYAAAYFAGTYLPGKLVAWVPQVSGIWLETASMGARLAVAYVLGVAVWLVLLSLLARLGTDSVPPAAGVPEPGPGAPPLTESAAARAE